MNSLNTKRKFPSVALLMGALVTCALIAGACSTNHVKSDASNTEASADKPMAEPPKPGEPFFEDKPLPKGPEVLADYRLPSTEVPSVIGVSDVVEPVQEGSNPKSINRALLDRFIKKGPRHALKLVTVQPAFQGSRFIGYQVVGFAGEGAKFSGALKPGDIVTKVNKKSIVRPEDYMAAWESLKTCDNVSVKVLREGEPIEMSWPVAAH